MGAMRRALPLTVTASAAALMLAASSTGAESVLAPGSAKHIRFLAMGDSYTIGESVTEVDRWPTLLAELLSAQDFQADVTIIARTGWTTDELWTGIQQVRLLPPYDLVMLLIGVNNQYRGRSLDQYRVQFRFLLRKAIEYAGGLPGRVIVLSIPDWGVTPFGSGRGPARVALEIDQFNAVNHDESLKAGAYYIDITPETRANGRDPAYIAPDGLHPSAKMYLVWAQLALPVSLEALSH